MFKPLWYEIVRGRITVEEFWAGLESAYGKPISKELRHTWNVWNTWALMKPRADMVDTVKKLKADGYRVGLLSNTVRPTGEDIGSHGGYTGFDPLILSYEVDCAKPDPEIYQLALEQLGDVKPDEVVFLDDTPIMLTPAGDLGMHTIHVTSSKQAISAINELIS